MRSFLILNFNVVWSIKNIILWKNNVIKIIIIKPIIKTEVEVVIIKSLKVKATGWDLLIAQPATINKIINWNKIKKYLVIGYSSNWLRAFSNSI